MDEDNISQRAGEMASDRLAPLKVGDPVARMWAQVNDLWATTIDMVPQLVVGLVVVLLTWLLAKLFRSLAGRTAARAHLRPSLVNFIRMLAGLVAWVVGLMIAAIIVFPNLTPSSMIAGLGIGTVAVGFAFKDIFENFFAGVFILLRQDMRIGDYVECEGIEGRVENISIRETRIRETDGELVVVPNALLFKNPLTIRTDRTIRRTTIICGVAYDVDLEIAQSAIQQAVASCRTVEQDDTPIQIFAQEFAESSINFEITWWTGSKPADIRESRDEVVRAVKRALDDAGLEIPFPYRTLTFKEPLHLRQPQDEGDR